VHEVIVIDDNSDDNTCEVLRAFGSRITRAEGSGQGIFGGAQSRHPGCDGGSHCVSDADDLWLPHKLEQQIKLLSDDCGFVFADWYRSDNPRNPGTPLLQGYSWVTEGSVFPNLLRENFVSTPTVIVRKELLAHTGLFKPKLMAVRISICGCGWRSVRCSAGHGNRWFSCASTRQHHEQPAIPILSGAAMAGVAA